MKSSSPIRLRLVPVVLAVAVVTAGTGVAQAYIGDTTVQEPNQPWGSTSTEDDEAPRPPGLLPEVDPNHDQADTRPGSMREALHLYDPESDPFTLVGQAPDGSYYTISIAMSGTPPDWVQTVDDFRAWQSQIAAER